MFMCLACSFTGYVKTYGFESIDPDAFDKISNNSINLLDTYAYFSDLVYENDNRTLIHANTIMMPDYYEVRTPVGPVVVTPLLADVLLYSRNFIFIATTVDLRIGWTRNPSLSPEYRYQYGWPNRSCIGGYRIGLTKGSDMTVGVVWRNTPYILTDTEGNKIFGFHDDPVFGIRTSTTTLIAPFFHVRALGADIVTTYDSENPEFNSAGIRIGIGLGKTLGKLEIGGNYSRFSNQMISGFSLTKFNPAKWLMLNVKFYEDNSTEKTSYFCPSASFFVNRGNEPKDSGKLDTYSSVDVGYSYSNDLFDVPVYGLSFGYSVDNVHFGRKWYGNASVAFSYNYHDVLYRIPLRDEILFSALVEITR